MCQGGGGDGGVDKNELVVVRVVVVKDQVTLSRTQAGRSGRGQAKSCLGRWKLREPERAMNQSQSFLPERLPNLTCT